MILRTPWKILKALMFTLIVILAFVFFLKNQQNTTINFFLETAYTAPLFLIMFFAMLLGMVIGLSIGGISVFTMMKNQQKKLKIKWENEWKKAHNIGNNETTATEKPQEFIVVPAP